MKWPKGKISIVHRVICFLLAAYLLNFSIDTRDAQSDAIAEDLSVNDIESVYELLAEGVVGVENAVEESDERDQEEGGSFEFKKFCFVISFDKVKVSVASCLRNVHSPFTFQESISARPFDVTLQPPRV